MTGRLIDQTARELARRIRGSELSCREVVTAHLDQIDSVNPQLNALVALRDRHDILAEAEAADSTKPVGPLHGLPVAVKDLVDVAGLPTRSGSPLTSDRPATKDGLIAERLRSAGAIIIAKTNTPEFGTGSHTFNPVYGLTRNPWNPELSAGGSSGGAAAAVAARMLPLADGSDFGGSLRNPASFCNLVGLRPSLGRVPIAVERSSHLLRLGVHGPLARPVDDTALLLSVLAGPDPRDPLARPADTRLAEPIVPAEGARIGWIGDCGEFVVEPEVLKICHTAASLIDQSDGSIADADIDLSNSMTVFRILRGVQYRDLSSQFSSDDQASMKQTIVGNIEYGLTLTTDDILTAERLRAGLHQEMVRGFQDHDVIALPTAQLAPFPADWEYPTEVAGHTMTDYLEWMTACCIITPTGCPAISVPAGLTAAGLPVGLQLVAPIGEEHRLLEIAAAIEAANPLHQLVP